MNLFKMIGLALMAILTGASFNACTSETEEVLGQDTEIRLTSEITPSRVTSLDYQSIQIVAGQQVGITIAGAKAAHNNIAWTAGTGGALTNTGAPVYYDGTETAIITAYHPHNSAWSGTSSYSFSVSTDQSIEANYRNSDLLWTTASSEKTANAVGLTFKHQLAKINVTLQSTDITDLSGATISICGTNINTYFNPSTGTLSAATADVQEIKAGVTTSTDKTASAIVVPQTVSNGTNFIKVAHGGKTFYYKLTADKELKSGFSHNYTLNVKATSLEVEIESDKIIDWKDEDGNIGDANEDTTPYLTFTADAEQTLTMSKAVATLEYSVNNGAWTELGTTTVTFGGDKGNLRLRGKNITGTSNSTQEHSTIQFGDKTPKVACSGDIRTLLDYENHTTVNTSNARFCYLFTSCPALTSAPELPATSLADCCYFGMFNGSGLTEAPVLPATTMSNECYVGMFSWCCYLTKAPALPATILAPECYRNMFHGCENLIEAPELPATTLATKCYELMFSGCAFTEAPELPATTLAERCYHTMFYYCTNLKKAPELPATTLAQSCYSSMFSGCTSLTEAPELPVTTLAQSCYSSMFSDCTSLTEAPELPATTLVQSCYWGMFRNCTSLTETPELPATTLADYSYRYMFSGCTNLTKVTMLATNIGAYNCLNEWLTDVPASGTFIKASSLESIPTGSSGIPDGWTVKNYGEE